MSAIYRPKTKNFRFFDLTKNAGAREMTLEETRAYIRRRVNEEVEKSFNSMESATKELRRIAELQGKISNMGKCKSHE